MRKLVAAAALLSLAAACSPKYRVVSNESESPVLSGQCSIQVLEAAPGDPFVVVGTVEPENGEKLAQSNEQLVGAIQEAACKRTANAVIVVRDDTGRITRGTLIRIR